MREELISNFKMILEKYNRYYGNSPYFFILLISIVLIFIISRKDDKKVRTILVWLPILLVIIIFNPVFYKYMSPIVDDGVTYWRFFWLLPLAPVLAYLFTRIVEFKDNKIIKFCFSGICIGVIVYSGKFMFTNENYQKVNNVYKIPDDILNAIQIVENGSEERKRAMGPTEVVPWVRQYCGTIELRYTRDVQGIYSEWINNYDNGITKKSIKRLIELNYNYFIVKKDPPCDCNFEEYNCVLAGENDTYLVYKCLNK